MQTCSLSHGAMEVLVTGDYINIKDMVSFFHPLFTVSNQYSGKNELLCTIKLITCCENIFTSISATYKSENKENVILYPSKRPDHHVEAFRVISEEVDENPVLYTNDYLIVCNPQSKTVELYYIEGRHIHQLLRVIIRDMFLRGWEQKGGLLLHASAVCKYESAIIFVGPKGSGKTNAQLECVNKDWSFLSFDRIMLQVDCGGEIQCLGWPTYFNLDFPTIDRFCNIFKDYRRYRTIRPDKDEKISLQAKDVDHLSFLRRGHLEQICFPHYGSIRQEAFGKAEAIKLVLNEIFPSAGSSWHGFVPLSIDAYHQSSNRLKQILDDEYIYLDGCLLKGSESKNAGI
ncbi:hypothetical protein [Paenibacillus glacialis]|uniref:Uncharacterized protein n=1 Tax=Paenibacillus glacialis TaxID=494026 RepID=A0A168D0Z4_9BACL|nr:hypothetical protein [Paenibacillus glacialis]OAB33782.1 hypothetical protein PGLA_22895 [Paenibacillus glacialis]